MQNAECSSEELGKDEFRLFSFCVLHSAFIISYASLTQPRRYRLAPDLHRSRPDDDPRPRVFLRRDGSRQELTLPADDELLRAWFWLPGGGFLWLFRTFWHRCARLGRSDVLL